MQYPSLYADRMGSNKFFPSIKSITLSGTILSNGLDIKFKSDVGRKSFSSVALSFFAIGLMYDRFQLSGKIELLYNHGLG